jgi:hypothetical protein
MAKSCKNIGFKYSSDNKIVRRERVLKWPLFLLGVSVKASWNLATLVAQIGNKAVLTAHIYIMVVRVSH